MQKIKIPKELQVGLLTIVVVVLIIVGLSYLKGYSVLATTSYYHSVFDDIKGLKQGDQILIQGHQVGQVHKIYYDPKTKKVVVEFWVENSIDIPEDSYVEIFARDFLGTMALKLVLGNSSKFLESGDALKGKISPSMIEELKEQVLPLKDKLLVLMDNLNKTVTGINGLVGDSLAMNKMQKDLSATLSNTKQMTARFAELSAKLQTSVKILNEMLQTNKPKFDTLSGNLVDISEKTKEILPATKKLLDSLQITTHQINLLLDTLNHGNGTASLFLKDPRVYNDLDNSLKSLDALLKELKEHPERFVHFSLFGRKNKE